VRTVAPQPIARKRAARNWPRGGATRSVRLERERDHATLPEPSSSERAPRREARWVFDGPIPRRGVILHRSGKSGSGGPACRARAPESCIDRRRAAVDSFELDGRDDRDERSPDDRRQGSYVVGARSRRPVKRATRSPGGQCNHPESRGRALGGKTRLADALVARRSLHLCVRASAGGEQATGPARDRAVGRRERRHSSRPDRPGPKEESKRLIGIRREAERGNGRRPSPREGRCGDRELRRP